MFGNVLELSRVDVGGGQYIWTRFCRGIPLESFLHAGPENPDVPLEEIHGKSVLLSYLRRVSLVATLSLGTVVFEHDWWRNGVPFGLLLALVVALAVGAVAFLILGHVGFAEEKRNVALGNASGLCIDPDLLAPALAQEKRSELKARWEELAPGRDWRAAVGSVESTQRAEVLFALSAYTRSIEMTKAALLASRRAPAAERARKLARQTVELEKRSFAVLAG
jgi:lysylphosphatidylglycerol synthetase-like protein (DUF2156 family)